MSEYESKSWRASRDTAPTYTQPDGDLQIFGLVDEFYNFSWLISPLSWNNDPEIYGVTSKNVFVSRFEGVHGLGGDYEYFVPNFMRHRYTELNDSIYAVHLDHSLLESAEPSYMYIKVHSLDSQKNPSWVEFYDPMTRKRERHDNASLLAWHESISFKIDVVSEELGESRYSNRYMGNADHQRQLKAKIYTMAVMYAEEDVTIDQIINVLIAVNGNFSLAYETLKTLIATDSLDVTASHIKEVYGQQKKDDIFF
jgi:hypothetical protein